MNPYNSNFRQPTLLVVEDSDDQWHIVHKAIQLTLPELKAVRMANAQQAITWLEGQEAHKLPRLILLDLYLPHRSDGLHVLEAIKNLGDPFNQIPIVIFSSSDEQGDIGQAYEEGVSAYMVKPVEFDQWIHFFNQLRAYWWETVRLPFPG